jgi:hypothetical protein
MKIELPPAIQPWLIDLLRLFSFDLRPINRTSHFSRKSITMKNDGHENKQIQRRADHLISEASGGRYADKGNRAQLQRQ